MFGPFDEMFDFNKNGVMEESEKNAERAFIDEIVRKEEERGDIVDPFREDDIDDNDIKFKDDDSYEDDMTGSDY